MMIGVTFTRKTDSGGKLKNNHFSFILLCVALLSFNVEASERQQAPTTGNANAKVTIVEYTDYQCPYCAGAHRTMKQLLKQYDGKIRLIMKHYPLTIHSWAEDAAVAAACVNLQNTEQFWKLSDFLFDHQKEVTKEIVSQTVIDFAKTAGLNVEELQQCIRERVTLDLVKSDIEEATSNGINGTPAFMINGLPVDGGKTIEYFTKVIDAALAESE